MSYTATKLINTQKNGVLLHHPATEAEWVAMCAYDFCTMWQQRPLGPLLWGQNL